MEILNPYVVIALCFLSFVAGCVVTWKVAEHLIDSNRELAKKLFEELAQERERRVSDHGDLRELQGQVNERSRRPS